MCTWNIQKYVYCLEHKIKLQSQQRIIIYYFHMPIKEKKKIIMSSRNLQSPVEIITMLS